MHIHCTVSSWYKVCAVIHGSSMERSVNQEWSGSFWVFA